MKTVISFLTIMTLSLMQLNCAGIKLKEFDPQKKIEVEERALGTILRQDNKILNLKSLVKNFKKRPETKEKLKGYGALFIAAMVLAGVGGYEIGTWAVNGDNDKLVDGLIMAAGGIGLGYWADKKLYSAVEVHNKKFSFWKKDITAPVVQYSVQF